MKVELFAGKTALIFPAPLLAVVSTVIVPWGCGFLPTVKNHVDRNASDGAAVGLGDGAGLGDGVAVGDGAGVGMGVGVGVGRILLETEPQPATKKSSVLIKARMAVRKGPPILAIRGYKKGNL
jgi:hypothetical protein